MNKELIPHNLHHLIPLVEKWGITDDGYRDEQIENSSTDELIQFVNSLDIATIKNINSWLSNEDEMINCSDEYINYTCFVMAFEYANAVLKDRL